MTDKEYFAIDSMSCSSLKLFARSPAHMLAGIEPTEAMNTGTMIHKWILEHHDFYSDYTLIPDELKGLNKNTNAYKDFKKDNDKIIIDDSDLEMLHAITHNLKALTHTRSGLSYYDIIQQSKKEIAVQGVIENVKYKGKIDALHEGLKLIIDLKKTDDAELFKFKAKNYKYHWQNWIYRELVSDLYFDMYDFLFLAIESKKPYGIKAYNITLDDLKKAGEDVCYYTNKYAEWVEAGKPYQLYSDNIETLYF